jgi:hypothetical protein
VEITSEFCETYRVHERASARFRFVVEVVSETDTVPETALLESSVSTDTLAESESPSVVLAVSVVAPLSSDTVVPVDAVVVAEVVVDTVVQKALVETAVALEDSVLAASVVVLRASREIRLSLLLDELAVVGVALEEAIEVTEDASLAVVAVLDVEEATLKVEV